MSRSRFAVALAVAAMALSNAALATNGMIMEGYGPVATAMGGAAMAYDNGTAAMANNPATLALAPQGNRMDLALGFIGPNVKVNHPTWAESKAEAFYMPALGYTRKVGSLAYGLGIYAQGGMGTEYANGDMAQVGVGRVILPLAYQLSERLTLGGSVDLVWAGMDLAFASYGINFKDHSDYSGKAKGYGLAAKLGFTYKLNDRVALGGVYQTAGNLSDLKGAGYKIKDFDMPPILALGVSWQANNKLQIVADVKDVMWGSSMNTVSVLYPGAAVCNPGINCAPFQQDWQDQVVLALGAAYKVNDRLTGRVGFNYGDNPIPTQNMNFLWPAIVDRHYTAGLGYALDANSELNASLAYVPEATQTNGLTVTHGQLNWQLMYSKKF